MEQALFARVAPRWHSAGQCTLLCAQGEEARHCPCHSAAHAHEEATLPCVSRVASHCRRCCCHCNCNRRHHLHCRPHCRQRWPLLLSLPLAIAVPVAISHCRYRLHCHRHRHCHRYCDCCRPLPSLLPSAITVAATIGHCCWHPRWPSPLLLPSLSPLPLPFEPFKQIKLSLFYLVWTVSGALIAVDDWPGVRWRWSLANTSVGWQAASNERLVGASGWRQGGSRVETLPAYWLAMQGVLLLCCRDASHWQMAFVMMCWMW